MTEESVNDEVDLDGLDANEDESGDPSSVKPWDPKKIRITTKSFTLREIVDQIQDGDIDLSPDFQREYIWKSRQRTRLIESVLLGIPLPAFYFDQSENGIYQVVDGVQRLSTINLYMNNGFELSESHLEYLSELKGRVFDKLDQMLIRRFKSAQIVVHIIEPQTPDEVKYDIFNRVNTLGSPLSAQEIRHAMSGVRSRTFLMELAEDESFDLATENHYWRKVDGHTVRDSRRMANRELALRFCAFRTCSMEEYKEFSSLNSFLMNFTKRVDGAPDSENFLSNEKLQELKEDFTNAMKAASEILEESAFRRIQSGSERRGPINRAVFEAQANALADRPIELLREHKREIREAFRIIFDDPEYTRSVTVSTGSASRVSYRFENTEKALTEALS